MKISDASDILKSSCLAPLFTNLENPEMQEKDGRDIFNLTFKNPISDEEPATLTLVEDKDLIVLMIRNLYQSKDGEVVARVAHVNHMTMAPKMCWDPDDGEIYVKCSHMFDPNQGITPIIFEQLLANLLYIYYGERRYFFSVELTNLTKKGILGKEQAQSMLNQLSSKIESEFFPPLSEVIEGS